MTHRFDPMTEFCVDCGTSRCAAADRPISQCPATPNVTGISHIIARKRLAELTRVFTNKPA
jgi:hypothetical protein